MEWLIAACIIDRVGKDLRGASRDALVADITPSHLRAASFEVRQSLDTIGTSIGPLLAIGLIWLTAGQFHTVFRIAVIPAFLAAVGVLLIWVREPERPRSLCRVPVPLSWSELTGLSAMFWWVVAVAVVFTPA